ncbi:MAG: carboxypeptidase regulatory-like domain-containing protein [Bryobacterales bacterium]|nr:carboxypeptidase regulatory-like domain-containing protein [Bryobacterales bacterium]
MAGELRVLSPCSRDRASLDGEGAVRWCPECRKNVYDLARMRRRDIDRLTAQGECCGIIERDADGAMRTADPPPLRRRVLEWMVGVAAGVRWAWAADGETGSVAGVVKDASGAPLPGARIELDGRTVVAGPDGGYTINGLAAGSHKFTVRMAGFVHAEVGVEVRVGETADAPVTLRLGEITMGIVVTSDLTAVVQDLAGQPIRGARVSLRDGSGRELAAKKTGRDGGVRFKKYAGYVVARVEAPGFKPWEGRIGWANVQLEALNRLP